MTNRNCKKILVMPAAGLGDFLMAAPAITVLRENYKTAHIAVLAHHLRGAAEIGKCLPFIDEVIDFPLKNYSWSSVILFFLGGFWPMFFKLRKQKFDVCFIFNSNPIRTIITKLLGVKTFENKKRGHPTRLALDLLAAAGIKSDKTDFCFVAPDIDISKFIPADSPRPWIGIHPFSAKWHPWMGFKELIKKLKKHNGTIILIGQHSDNPDIENSINLINKLSVAELCGVIKKLDLLITCDSGPMHIGFATNTPVVAIFGSVSPKYLLPIGECNVSAIYKGDALNDDFKTVKERKVDDYNVFDKIDADEVYFNAVKIIRTRISNYA
ncbi:MAG TPA: hypothetical protein DDW84_06130 [Phycisphaerales bacterium]|nr:MAG: hypothetical protein A2Y13_08405 [Planctomycetes bacterium GWC2_45_44]HBG78410.1 hypothetical protein [Phycisphaerales bacterium]HBR19693.1 hypothetical protein [Phycisphaerales bacterium]